MQTSISEAIGVSAGVRLTIAGTAGCSNTIDLGLGAASTADQVWRRTVGVAERATRSMQWRNVPRPPSGCSGLSSTGCAGSE